VTRRAARRRPRRPPCGSVHDALHRTRFTGANGENGQTMRHMNGPT
jgi:hypothetical protein